MIEELKQLLTMVQEMPEMVLHVLLGFAIYKTIIFLGTSAGIYGTIRLGINKWHDYKTRKMEKPIEKIIKYDLGKHFISGDGSFEKLQELILRLRQRRIAKDKNAKIYEYVFVDDVQFLIDAFQEKIEREYGVTK